MPDLFGNADPVKTAKPVIPADEQSTNYHLISNLTYKGKPIRRAKLEDGTEVWVVTDVIGAVTDSKNPRNYWAVTKRKLIAEGWDGVTKIHLISVKDSMGREQKTQVMTLPQLLRMLQSLPSKKAEPFRIFMAEAGYTLIKEAQNPDLAIQRGYEGYIKKGYSPAFASRRAKSVIHRKALTEAWRSHGVSQPREYAMLTDRESRGVFGKSTGEMKRDRNLPATGNLRDRMSLSEIAAQDMSDTVIAALVEKHNPYGYEENGLEVDKGSAVGRRLLADLQRTLEG